MKKGLLIKTVINNATEAFNQECTRLRSICAWLDYPLGLINYTIDNFLQNTFSYKENEKAELKKAKRSQSVSH